MDIAVTTIVALRCTFSPRSDSPSACSARRITMLAACR